MFHLYIAVDLSVEVKFIKIEKEIARWLKIGKNKKNKFCKNCLFKSITYMGNGAMSVCGVKMLCLCAHPLSLYTHEVSLCLCVITFMV